MNIGFIGAGKVGCTLGKYIGQKAGDGTTVKGYYSRSRSSAEEAARFTQSRCFERIEALIGACDVIFLTVPDGSIQDTWNQVKEYDIEGKTICHCSGAMSSEDAFPGIRETGAFGYSIHPLFAVSDKYNAYRELTGVFFTLEGASPRTAAEEGVWSRTEDTDDMKDGAAQSTTAKSGAMQESMAKAGAAQNVRLSDLQALLHAMGNPTRIIAGKDKTTYHCAAAMASNLVCGLIHQSIALMQRCGFTEEEAAGALAPILTGNMAHIASKGPTASLTGPIERNDIHTVRKHLSCLADDERQLYSLLSSRLIEMAQTRHPDRDYRQMQQLMAISDAGMSQRMRKEEEK